MDLNLNHGEELIEDLLGNNREYTLALRDAFRDDSRARFRLTAIMGGLMGAIGIIFLVIPFIPGIITLWLMGMAVGMFLAGVLGLIFSRPLTDGVSVHLKVIDYVDNVIKNSDYRRPNLMDDKKDDPEEELPEKEERNDGEEGEDSEEEGPDGIGEEVLD